MKRIDKILGRPTGDVQYLDDIKLIKSKLPDLYLLTNRQVEKLWIDFSDSVCAQYLYVSEGSIQEFEEWLNQDLYGEAYSIDEENL